MNRALTATTAADARRARALAVLTRYVDAVGWTRPATNSDEVRGIEEQFLPNAVDKAGLLVDEPGATRQGPWTTRSHDEVMVRMSATFVLPHEWQPVAGRQALNIGDAVPAHAIVLDLDGNLTFRLAAWTTTVGPVIQIEHVPDAPGAERTDDPGAGEQA